MKKSAYKIIIAAVISLPLFISSCIHNDFEEPPINTIPTGDYLNLDQIYQIYTDSVLNLGKTSYKFTEDYSLTAVVIMDDKSGNIYKSSYLQDATKGINLHLMSSGGLYEGDSVRVYLKGLVLSEYAGMMQLDSVQVDKNIIKIATMKDIEPEVVTIDQIFTGQYLAKVIKLENVQFSDDDLGTTYADAENLITMNKNLVDEIGQTIIVRTSGYASFAKNNIPVGRGSVIAVVGKFNTDWQLLIRSTHEVVFDQRRFGDVDTVFYEGFANAVTGTAISFTGWVNYAVNGTLSWLGFNNNIGAEYAKIDGTGSEALNYLVLPVQELDNCKLSFRSRAAFLQNASLEVLVSTNYDGILNPDLSIFTWTVIDANIGTAPTNGYGDWTVSDEIDLSSFSGNAYIAFRYNAAASQKGIFLIDDILIYKD